jgi:hypothetical protein
MQPGLQERVVALRNLSQIDRNMTWPEKMKSRISALNVFESRNHKIHTSSKGWMLLITEMKKVCIFQYDPLIFLKSFSV